MLESNIFSTDNSSKVSIYHGSTSIIKKPEYNYGREDNDYGKGFYTTAIFDKAVSWAKGMGDSNRAIVNEYLLDTSNLNVLNLDDYGPLAWIAEIAAHRPLKSDLSQEFLPDFVNMYKIDTSDVDVIIGYRADDSYTDVIGAFCDGILNCDEVKRMFYKGNLGEQYFIKSEKAFETLQFSGYTDVQNVNMSEEIQLEINARNEVNRFINQRRVALAKRFQVPPITIIDAIADQYVYNKEYDIYEILL